MRTWLSGVNAEIESGVRCIVLAGGRSRRMGRDKADLLLDGRPLLEWVLQAPRSADLPSDVLRRDRVEGLGPLGGVRTAFERYREDSLLFLA